MKIITLVFSLIALSYVQTDDVDELNRKIEIYQGVKSFVCKEDFIGGELIKKCFYLLSQLKNEGNAKNICKQLDPKAALLTINSKEEQQFISSALVSNPNIKDNVWLGLEYGWANLTHDTPQHLRWRWDNSVDSPYFNWCPGPNCAFDDEDARNWGDCARMSVQNISLGLWYSHPCEANLNVVCELSSKK
ncbi:regenerating islet-derived protein 3-gamma-like [Oppia nitens]|uniref:regenerating islet-derived protein 3-gamma-like n=1 Tax=Oppia nitens TaxID=1686743 RepID=UPI0023DB023C|nr:regenerating islet-derived protein 3-gamma-like [Oppia nitens]